MSEQSENSYVCHGRPVGEAGDAEPGSRCGRDAQVFEGLFLQKSDQI